ncbi:cyclic GMP-AMP synthase DncV-like nucleotidyltransferase [Parasediminibacterium sp. JCM 36343]|uniref:cyclic GMP-AMP synthase DncV-like nucleotidyltransferase n=1 Tax=Parasediminibacterium sp. JCM 36343 TaxID=3374279 RepID=UPI00397830ED
MKQINLNWKNLQKKLPENFKKVVPLLLGGIAVSSLITLIKELSKTKNMANAHNFFLNFEQRISLPTSKKQKLIASRKALEKKITDYFRFNTTLPIPKFYIQGSFKMGTMVVDKEGTYDVDLGVYFLTNPYVLPITLQRTLLKAVTNHTTIGTQHREKCVRVIYKGDFDIDLPVYYKLPQDAHPYLATKMQWVKSDPKELCEWFKSRKDRNGQLVRLVKYFKYWANTRSRKMPSGIAFSIWVAKYYKANARDDIAFYETAKAIQESIWLTVSCKNPVTPFDDFTDKLNSQQKVFFKTQLDTLIKNSKMALEQKTLDQAIIIWTYQFGYKFIT